MRDREAASRNGEGICLPELGGRNRHRECDHHTRHHGSASRSDYGGEIPASRGGITEPGWSDLSAGGAGGAAAGALRPRPNRYHGRGGTIARLSLKVPNRPAFFFLVRSTSHNEKFPKG